jgi:hypothetical protein
LTLLNDWNGRILDVLPSQATTEWVNGGAYFIKNTNVQSEFWFADGNQIAISLTDRTKFVVRDIDVAQGDPRVLIRSDKITIELAANASTANPQYLTLEKDTSYLKISSEPYTWTFNDFFVTLGITRYASQGNWENVIIHSPGTSVVWDLV